MLAIGERYRNRLETALMRYKIDSILWLPDNPDIDPRLAGHADLSIFSNDNIIVTAKGIRSYIVNSLTCKNFTVIEASPQTNCYPGDAGLCICRAGKYDIYNPKTVDPVIEPFLNPQRIAVNQGYTRCSICVLPNDGIITSDHAISSRASEFGLDALLIEPGHIVLDGFDYGFIGGASLKLSESMIAFTGTLDKHPDKSRILDFIARHRAEAVFLTDDPVFDIGGAVALP